MRDETWNIKITMYTLELRYLANKKINACRP